MTTTTTFSGMDPSGRNSSRVLRPPGGGSNFSLGFDEPKEQPVRRNKMASSIFGTPEENPPSWAKSSEFFCTASLGHRCCKQRIVFGCDFSKLIKSLAGLSQVKSETTANHLDHKEETQLMQAVEAL
ncbi:jupiter microtubule associated homolog 1 isoform 1-T1 [Rhynochetos jubatus]